MRNEPWDFYKHYASNYGDWQYTYGVKHFQTAEKDFLIDHIEPGSKVIDIGCGPGEHIASILDKHCEITAVDFVQEMIDVAKARVGNEVRFICDDINNLSFPENYFNYGVCYCTLPNQQAFQTVFDRITLYCQSLIISIYDWEQRSEVVDFYRLNGLHSRVDDGQRTIFLEEGLRYIFIPEDVVRDMYERNGYDLKVNPYDFGKIYYGMKRS
jgi:SAM-dependent methyltransferase